MSDLYRAPTLSDDLFDIALGLCGVLVILVFVVLGLAFGHWFAGVLYRIGLQGSVPEGVAYLVAFFLTVLMTLTVLGRVINGCFWWRG